MISQTIVDLFFIIFGKGGSIDIVPCEKVPAPISLQLPPIQNITLDSLYLDDRIMKVFQSFLEKCPYEINIKINEMLINCMNFKT